MGSERSEQPNGDRVAISGRLDDEPGLVDALAHLGVWPAAIAAALVQASGLAFGRSLADPALLELMSLAFCGTLIVYDVDRLRDLERDRATAPQRAAFVETRRRGVLGLIALAGAGCAILAPRLSAGAWLLCASALALGLLHRRMKTQRNARVAYVSGAWLAIVVGLPAQAWLAGAAPAIGAARFIGALLVAQGSAIAANLICSGIRGQRDGGIADLERGRLKFARGLAAFGAIASLVLGGLGVWPLAILPASQAAVALRFRSDEHYRHAVLDVSLLVGAIGASGLLSVLR